MPAVSLVNGKSGMSPGDMSLNRTAIHPLLRTLPTFVLLAV